MNGNYYFLIESDICRAPAGALQISVGRRNINLTDYLAGIRFYAGDHDSCVDTEPTEVEFIPDKQITHTMTELDGLGKWKPINTKYYSRYHEFYTISQIPLRGIVSREYYSDLRDSSDELIAINISTFCFHKDKSHNLGQKAVNYLMLMSTKLFREHELPPTETREFYSRMRRAHVPYNRMPMMEELNAIATDWEKLKHVI